MSSSSNPNSTLIVGGGPVGCLLALELKRRGLPSLILDARKSGDAIPDRTLALSWLTVQTLVRHSVLQSSELTPIKAIHVGQHRLWSGVRLEAEEAGVEALGYTVPYSTLQNACETALHREDIPLKPGIRVNKIGCSASWAVAFGEHDEIWMHRALVLAEGGGLKPEGWRYHEYQYAQSAWIASLKLDTQGVAYERFTERGILAFLPDQNGSTLIFSLNTQHYAEWCALSREEQNHWLAQHCPASLVWSSDWTVRAAVPLRFQALRSEIKPPLWVVGNAAQIMHPVAGLGFNLGVRDVLDTAASLHQFFRPTLGDAPATLGVGRQLDRRWIQSVSHTLARWGHSNTFGWQHARVLGLNALQMVPPLKSALLQSLIWGF